MALPLNSIGPFAFLGLAGSPQLPAVEAETRMRQGQDGKWISLTGTRAKTTTLQSQVDAFHIQDGHLAVNNYISYIGAAPVTLVYHGVNYFTAFGIKYIITDVSDWSVQPQVGMVGGLFFPSRAMVMATWTLEAVEV